ncbi:MAG: replication-associated recombination protein A [Actinomycetota bacterium]|nr:replication-associated recombination protein A [Actinomycetota bacterium]
MDQDKTSHLNSFALEPLASRMRPRRLDDFFGQEKIISKGAPLATMIAEDGIRSVVFWGPPGTGKTTLAEIISNITKSHFRKISAVSAGVAEMRKIIDEARALAEAESKRTILFIDEIHRFNKAQQDILLPVIEDGTIALIGATTENPYFEVNPPLISRSWVFRFEPLSSQAVGAILRRALKLEGGEGDVSFEGEAIETIADMAGGDGRTALNLLEAAILLAEKGAKGKVVVGKDLILSLIPERKSYYGKGLDVHYDNISAFIKSIRGSDPDAAIHWLTAMLKAGEDPKFIARRMIILASEDIGLANSRALEVAVSAFDALNVVGLPEAKLNLAHAALYLSLSPKSNSVTLALMEGERAQERYGALDVPNHLKEAGYSGAKEMKFGQGYKYPHNYPNNFVDQNYMPDELKEVKYYHPSSSGLEGRLYADWLKRRDGQRRGK